MAKTAPKKTTAKAAATSKTKAKVTPTAAKKERKKKPDNSTGDPNETYNTMKEIFTVMDADMDKFLINETKAAGRKIRKGAQSLRKLAADLRKQIQYVATQRKLEDGKVKKKVKAVVVEEDED